MAPFFTILSQTWKYRWEIAAVLKLLAAMRKTAEEITREYIRRRVKQKLLRALLIVGVEILFLALAYVVTVRAPGLGSSLLASLVLWGVTLYNLFELVFHTVPELFEVRKMLKSKMGYAVKYLLRISLVLELTQGNLLFLVLSLFLGISSRTLMGGAFSFLKPWTELFLTF